MSYGFADEATQQFSETGMHVSTARPMLGGVLIAAAVLALSCGQSEEPDESVVRQALESVSKARNLDDAFVALEESIPGFAGMWIGDDGRRRVKLTKSGNRSPADRATIRAIARQVLRGNADGRSEPVLVEDADHTFSQLVVWRNEVATFVEDGVLSTDADELSNKVSIAVASEAASARLREWWDERGLPAGALEVRLEQPRIPLQNLTSSFRPVPGGVVTRYSGGNRCTLGYAAFHQGLGVRGFVTNSHCSQIEGGVEDTWYAQPGGAWFWADKVGFERLDPRRTSLPGCPAGHSCRRSDSLFVQADSSSQVERGKIARPQFACAIPTVECSLAVSATDSRFRVWEQGVEALVGQQVNKVGLRTGWTVGTVIRTCQTISFNAIRVSYLCSSTASAGAGSGDSGSAVFVSDVGTAVTGVGLLFGGGGSCSGPEDNRLCNEFDFSPLAAVEQELGLINFTDSN